MKLRKPFRILLTLIIFSLLFIAYIHFTKDKIVTAAVLDKTNDAVSVNIQNPFVVPITIYHSKVVDQEDREMPATSYNIVMNGSFGSLGSTVDQAMISRKTDVFEELKEVVIPGSSSKKEKNYTLYMREEERKSDMDTAKEVSISFKVFSFLPFHTKVKL
ncbi:hypothetical protein JOC95_004064 [Bacillus tianshenii]|uniref:Uncharacterized protein n=1 Tax=Sutcliffiella tianshenii TaxID=1463404 RepID=A0ABS2P6E7_9BACI|nr:hypothetical protein [Bacillus tianshenii]MBM7622153.1 hypothetical protein [Bacillus tianshenii]